MNDVPVTSPSCSLTAPLARKISYLAAPFAAGQEIVAVRSVTALALSTSSRPKP